MVQIVLAVVAASAVLIAPLVTPANAQGVRIAQVDMRTGRHLDDRDPSYDRERRGYGSDVTVGVGPGAKLTTGRSAVRRLPAGVRKSRP
jgi:hypothetical protein